MNKEELLGAFLALNIPINLHYLNRYINYIISIPSIRENEGYGEYHHILPESLFPKYKKFNNAPWNQKRIRARYHYVSHWLLWKALPADSGMKVAFWGFVNGSNGKYRKDNIKINSRTYEKLRIEISEDTRQRFTGCVGHWRGKYGEEAPRYGKPASQEHKDYMSSLYEGRTWDDIMGEKTAKEAKEKMSKRMSGEGNNSYGKLPILDVETGETGLLSRQEYLSQMIDGQKIRYVSAQLKGKRGINIISGDETYITKRGKIRRKEIGYIDLKTMIFHSY